MTELSLVFTPNGRDGLAVHACRQVFYARGRVLHMEADKACLVHGHHCEHARTREAERTQSNEAIAWLWEREWEWVLKKKWMRSSLKRV